MSATVFTKDDEYILGHCARHLARDNLDDRHNYFGVFEQPERGRISDSYLADSLQYLFPVASVALYGPSGDQSQVRDPRKQDNKNDFQKQNVCEFKLTITRIYRGYVHSGDWTGCFIHFSYEPGASSPLVDMSMRGWRSYLGVGQSSNPHGGVGSLEFRNLYSNYFGYEARRQEIFGPGTLSELGREMAPWSFGAYGRKPPPENRESFLTSTTWTCTSSARTPRSAFTGTATIRKSFC